LDRLARFIWRSPAGNFEVLGIEYCDRQLTIDIARRRQPLRFNQQDSDVSVQLLVVLHGYNSYVAPVSINLLWTGKMPVKRENLSFVEQASCLLLTMVQDISYKW